MERKTMDKVEVALVAAMKALVNASTIDPNDKAVIIGAIDTAVAESQQQELGFPIESSVTVQEVPSNTISIDPILTVPEPPLTDFIDASSSAVPEIADTITVNPNSGTAGTTEGQLPDPQQHIPEIDGPLPVVPEPEQSPLEPQAEPEVPVTEGNVGDVSDVVAPGASTVAPSLSAMNAATVLVSRCDGDKALAHAAVDAVVNPSSEALA